MLKTLHTFLTRELAKVTVLSLMSFTLVMTVFAIVEPLRKQGLSMDQVAALIGYTLPVMLSLTLPIAALFAATIVYGRFSQDNELMACRASGLATLALLRPVLVLGLLVTLVSLWLSNFVSPHLAERAEKFGKANIRGLAFRELRVDSYVRDRNIILHADLVDANEDVLYGVVMADTKHPDDVRFVMAERTKISFQSTKGQWYVAVEMDDPVVSSSGSSDLVREGFAPVDSLPLKSPYKEDPSWYGWNRLVWTLDHPAENRDIQRSLEGIKRDIGNEMFAREVADRINADHRYAELAGRRGRCEILAPRAEHHGAVVELQSDSPGTRDRKRVVVHLRSETENRTITADGGQVEAKYSERWNASLAYVVLEGNVLDRTDAAGSARGVPTWEENQRDRVDIGELELPKALVDSIAKISLNDVYEHAAELTASGDLLKRVADVRDQDIVRLQGKILAEMHGRIAYGLSCFLLVAMGAAMGILYRGGQILSAFALSVIPAAIIIVMVLMGKQMISNPEVPKIYGVASIWGGVVLLLLGNLWLYAGLMKK